MAVVSQRASLSNWGPDYSQLDIDGIPDKYNTQGKLESIYTDSANNTNPVGVDNFLNTNAEGFTIQAPVGVTQFINDGQTSIYGFPGAIPPPTDFFLNTHANGFTIQAPTLVTQFIDPGNSSIYGFAGGSQQAPTVDFFTNKNRLGFKTWQAPGVSYFVNDGQTSRFGFQGALPPGVDYFTNDHAVGFTLRAPVGVTQFTYDGQTSQYGFPGKLPPAVDFFTNTHAKGFTIKNPVGETQFIGVGGSGTSYINPSGLNALRNVNYFSDPFSGAEGFRDRPATLQSYYLGISPDQTKYQYPDTVKAARLMNVRLGQGAGTAKLENQLGAGSKMGNKGFYAENRYAEAVRNDSNQSLLASWALRRRSPSPLEQQYSKFKLRDEAFNPTFIGHPLILRGLQNPDVLNPQRWGLDALGQQEGRTAGNNIVAAIDGGFIRGGASTALERAAIDTARIAKFMASPKGLIWSITQVGLGKSNIRPHGAMPYAEIALATKNPLPLLNNTQTHLGLTSLLSVPGSAFGLHFTRHGIPFLNEVASYEYVLKSFTREETDKPGVLFNKLNRLKDELLDIDNPYDVGLGQPISNLSYPGGPQSVYGIGNTIVKRSTDTLQGYKRYLYNQIPPVQLKEVPPAPDELPIEDIGSVAAQAYAKQAQAILDENAATSIKNAQSEEINKRNKKLDLEFTPKYDFKKRYAPGLLNNKTGQGSIQDDKQNASALSTKNEEWASTSTDAKKLVGLNKKLTEIGNKPEFVPGDGKLGDPNGIVQSFNPPKHHDVDGSSTSGNKHSVLPYNELRRIARDRNARITTINDFRSNLSGTPEDRKSFSTDATKADYENNNLQKRYGFGDHGNRNHDRSDPFSNNGKNNIDFAYDLLKQTGHKALAENPNFKGDKITATDYIPGSRSKGLDELYPKDTRDFIKFYFSGPELVDNSKDDIIVFRATIKGLSDSFSPGWSPIQIMGRPDGPALYNSFERNISFNFTVAATTREELVPMWRKLNYLSTYTMPIYGAGRPGGSISRLTIGDMFNQTPGYFTGLSITVNDEATWDLADDLKTDLTAGTYAKSTNAKQLPNIVDVDVQFKIIHDWRPQKGGRAYSLYNTNFAENTDVGNWLWDSNVADPAPQVQT